MCKLSTLTSGGLHRHRHQPQFLGTKIRITAAGNDVLLPAFAKIERRQLYDVWRLVRLWKFEGKRTNERLMIMLLGVIGR